MGKTISTTSSRTKVSFCWHSGLPLLAEPSWTERANELFWNNFSLASAIFFIFYFYFYFIGCDSFLCPGNFYWGACSSTKSRRSRRQKKSELAAAVISPLLEKRVLFYGFNAAGSGGLPFTPRSAGKPKKLRLWPDSVFKELGPETEFGRRLLNGAG